MIRNERERACLNKLFMDAPEQGFRVGLMKYASWSMMPLRLWAHLISLAPCRR